MRNPNINVGSPVDGAILSWRGTEGTAEISDFGPNFRFHQVYRDACDLGMSVLGKSGEIVTFVITLTHSRDDETLSWDLQSVGNRGNHVDGRYRLTIFND